MTINTRVKHVANKSTEKLSYSINEACAAIGIGRTKLYEMIASKKLKVRKLGDRTLIRRPDLQRFVDKLPIAVR